MIQIVEAAPSNAGKIVDFQLAMAQETEDLALHRPTVEQGVNAVFEDESKGKYYLAKINGETVGALLTTYEWSDWRNGQVLWIQSVFVKKEFRGKGVFKALYKYIRELVNNSSTNYRGIRLYVDKTNASAQKVYEKLGMHNHHYDTYEWMADL